METTTVSCCRCSRIYTGPKQQPFNVTCSNCDIVIQYKPNHTVTYHAPQKIAPQISNADRIAISRKKGDDVVKIIVVIIAFIIGMAVYLHFRNANDQISAQVPAHSSQPKVITMPLPPVKPLYPLKTYSFYKIAYNWQFYQNKGGNFEKCDTNDQRYNEIKQGWQGLIGVTNGIAVKCYSDYADMEIDEHGQLKSVRLQTRGNYLYETKLKQFSMRMDVSRGDLCTLYFFNSVSATSIDSTPDN